MSDQPDEVNLVQTGAFETKFGFPPDGGSLADEPDDVKALRVYMALREFVNAPHENMAMSIEGHLVLLYQPPVEETKIIEPVTHCSDPRCIGWIDLSGAPSDRDPIEVLESFDWKMIDGKAYCPYHAEELTA